MKGSILAAIVLASSPGAHAADILLNIPVSVSSLDLNAAISVVCNLCNEAPRCNSPQARVLARKTAPLPIVNGSYSGTIQVVFSGLSDMQARDAKVYACSLTDTTGTGLGPAYGLTRTQIKPNSNPATSVQGTVP